MAKLQAKTAAYPARKGLGRAEGRVVAALHEAWYAAEVERPLPRERLHGVKHAVMHGQPLEHAHRQAARRVQEHLVLAPLAEPRQHAGHGAVLQRHYVDVCLGGHPPQVVGGPAVQGRGQPCRRAHRAAVHLHHVASRPGQRRRQARGGVARSYHSYPHDVRNR